MATFASRAIAILALLAVWLDMSVSPLYAQAADVEVTEDAPATEAAEATSTDAAEGGEEASNEEKGQQFVDSARELQEKLAQLKALLDTKGEGADPALKEKLAGLENQLKGLGLDGLTGGGGSNPELTEFLSACVAMSMRRAGMQRPATLGSLRKLVQNKLSPADASKTELWKMVAVCVSEFKEDEFADFKTGKVRILPKVYVDAAKKPEAEKKVLELEENVWEGLKTVSEALLNEVMGNIQNEDSKLPSNIAYLALIPLLLIWGAMAWGFRNMKKRDDEKKEKAAKKNSKKAA